MIDMSSDLREAEAAYAAAARGGGDTAGARARLRDACVGALTAFGLPLPRLSELEQTLWRKCVYLPLDGMRKAAKVCVCVCVCVCVFVCVCG